MQDGINEKLIGALFKFKKANNQLLAGTNLNMGEIVAMLIIDEDCSGGEKTKLISKIGETLCITQSAVSQMLGSLEKKGYLYRKINEGDKRKFLFALTETGQHVSHVAHQDICKVFVEIITRFGEGDTLQLAELLERFSNIAELTQNELGGKHNG